MSNAAVTELIWHFAGYLQIFDTADRDRDQYDGDPQLPRDISWHSGGAGWIRAPDDLDDLGSSGFRFNVGPIGPGPVPGFGLSVTPDAWTPVPALATFQYHNSAHPAAPVPLPSSAGGISFTRGDAGTPYELTWDVGGDTRLVVVRQSNNLSDVDALLSVGELDGAAPGSGGAILASMADEAADALPPWAFGFPAQSDEWSEYLQGLETETAGPMSVSAGTYVDGVLLDEGETGPDTEPPEREALARPSDTAFGTAIAAGGNVQVNDALIVDGLEAARVMAVMGDVHQRDVIMQVIVHQSESMLPDHGVASDDLTANIASFQHTNPGMLSHAGITATGLQVRIDVADTDILDVKSLFQKNIADDGDLVAWGGTDAWSDMVLGANLQANAARLLDFGTGYDMIIVLGNYHSLNMIVQVGILRDNDLVITYGDGETGVDAGGNRVFNEATIDRRDSGEWSAMPDDIGALIAALSQGSDPGLAAWGGIPGSATGKLDILVVTGDWYDVNVIWQVNMLADDDVVVTGEGVEGHVSTGGNSLINAAKIIDFGAAYGQYAAGDVYQDLMLLQANIAYGPPGGSIIGADTQTLASEFVAFLELGSQAGDGMDGPALPYSAPYDDSFGGVIA